MSNKEQTSLRLSLEAKRLLEILAMKLGVPQTAIIEMAIREFATRTGITQVNVKGTNMFIGMSLGRSFERSALSIVEQIGDAPFTYRCRYLRVWEPATSLKSVLYDVLPLLVQLPKKPTVVIDVTVAGTPVGKMLQEGFGSAATTEFCTITSGMPVVNVDGLWQVPYNELPSILKVLMETERLQIAAGLAHGTDLYRGLQNFKFIELTADDAALTWRTHEHDDLVLATALALWMFEKRCRAFFLPGIYG